MKYKLYLAKFKRPGVVFNFSSQPVPDFFHVMGDDPVTCFKYARAIGDERDMGEMLAFEFVAEGYFAPSAVTTQGTPIPCVPVDPYVPQHDTVITCESGKGTIKFPFTGSPIPATGSLVQDKTAIIPNVSITGHRIEPEKKEQP